MRVADLKPGILIDLAGDPYADPEGTGEASTCARISGFEFEYTEVLDVVQETPDCTRLDTSEGSFGFPPDHDVIVFD